MTKSGYILAGQPSELDRLQLQSKVWEPAGRRLLEQLGDGQGLRVLDVGCGCLGWLRVLSEWVGPGGRVVGADVDDGLLKAADAFVRSEGLSNVELVCDDLFATALAAHSFDLVHSRFEVGPLGRGAEQVAAYRQLVEDGGWLVLEDPDTGSWHFNPPAPAAERLIALAREAFLVAGGVLDAGRHEYALLRSADLIPNSRAEVVALAPEHPYLRLPTQFSVSLEARLLCLIPAEELNELRTSAETELAAPGVWGTTFTLVQMWAKVPC